MKYQLVMFMSGLRGPVAFALSMAVPVHRDVIVTTTRALLSNCVITLTHVHILYFVRPTGFVHVGLAPPGGFAHVGLARPGDIVYVGFVLSGLRGPVALFMSGLCGPVALFTSRRARPGGPVHVEFARQGGLRTVDSRAHSLRWYRDNNRKRTHAANYQTNTNV